MGQRGPAYFLVPVVGDVAAEEREIRRALAKVSLRLGWAEAEARGVDRVTDEAIDDAVGTVRERKVARR